MFDTNDIQATLGQLAKQAFGHVAKSVFEPCSRVGCAASSPGWTCSECKQPTCSDHGFATLPTPKHPRPVVVCLGCIAPPAEAPRARARG
jgi:hypothetical protein